MFIVEKLANRESLAALWKRYDKLFEEAYDLRDRVLKMKIVTANDASALFEAFLTDLEGNFDIDAAQTLADFLRKLAADELVERRLNLVGGSDT